jgi:exopolysaccharide production protein ExoQ
LLVCVALWPLSKTLRWRHAAAITFSIFAVLIGVITAALLWTNSEAILGALGRDTTLSGRTVVWGALLEIIQQRPWLGYGYGAFWVGWTGPSAHIWLWMLGMGGYYPLIADNGYLDLWLFVGFAGVLVFALGFVRTFVRAVRWVSLTKTVEGLWPITFMTFMLVYNGFESAILSQNNILWILYVEVSLSMATLTGVVGDLSNVGVPPSNRAARNHQIVSHKTGNAGYPKRTTFG